MLCGCIVDAGNSLASALHQEMGEVGVLFTAVADMFAVG